MEGTTTWEAKEYRLHLCFNEGGTEFTGKALVLIECLVDGLKGDQPPLLISDYDPSVEHGLYSRNTCE